MQNSHLSLEHAKTAPFRAWDVRDGVAGASVSDPRGSCAKLRGANFGAAERIATDSTNREADFQPEDASGSPESTNGQTALRPNVAKPTSGQTSVRPESTIGDAKSANQETSFRSKAPSDTGRSTNGEAGFGT